MRRPIRIDRPRWDWARRTKTTTLSLAALSSAAILVMAACGPRQRARSADGMRTSVPTTRAGTEPIDPCSPGATCGTEPEPLSGPVGPGTPVHLSFYYLAEEPCPDRAEVPLPKCGGGAHGMVSAAFKRSLAMQGSGRLCNGRVVSVKTINPLCFAEAPAERNWGSTASGRPAVPFRSIAVDPRRFPLGHWYVLPAIRGVSLPSPAQGELHDGCVRADDTGGRIRGAVIDFFVGSREAIPPLHDRLGNATTLHDGAEACRHHQTALDGGTSAR